MQDLFVRRTFIGFVLKVVGLIAISWGIIQAFILMVQISDPFSHGMGFISFGGVVASSAIYGVVFIGFGEVIDLLQKIHDQNDPKIQALQAAEKELRSSAIAPVPIFAEQEIKEFYSNQNSWVDSILPTKNRNIFIVKTNGRIEYIELGGPVPKTLNEDEASEHL
jgi:hypothetical protein